ncbi:MAG: squalene/phytoene synthase family protein, partial [archaeon]
CYHVAGIPGILMAHVGGAPPHAYAYAESLGIGMQLTNMIRDVKEDAEMGRVYFPRDEWKEFGIVENDFSRNETCEPLKEFLRFQAGRAHRYYSEAEKGMDYLSPDTQLPMRLCSLFYREILEEIARQDYEVLAQRVAVPHERKIRLLEMEMRKRAYAFDSAIGVLEHPSRL